MLHSTEKVSMSRPSNFQQKKKLDHHEKLTRQLSNFSSSNEAYHGGKSASIPFTWESQPGTPKVRFQDNYLPPLTPPPSYFQNATKNPITKSKKNPKASFLQTMFSKRSTRKGCPPQPPGPSSFQSYSSSSSSSSLSSSSPRPTSYSVPSSPMVHSRTSFSVPSSPMVHWRKGEEEEDLYEVSDSNMSSGGNARSRGRYSSMFKKVLLGDFR
ncbi:uncharacterized protein LOC130731656 [Lotus japonicus]|uniref:uncharacterized protein LOC130731656 n=1 Tax=Lotus japonicus TaxID=34305 RepID=UPI00258D2ECE|nr:uncharacterized protein LOC130731656 [Lotus japonicus]